jgi:hypothetical protein
MWDAFNSSATDFVTQQLGLTSFGSATAEEIAAGVKEMTGNVTIQMMNTYVQLAGQNLRANANLAALELDQQIPGEAIFTPPWSTTGDNPAIPTRYILRVNSSVRDLIAHGAYADQWNSYMISGPLTSMSDLLNRANQLFNQNPSASRYRVGSINAYTLTVA